MNLEYLPNDKPLRDEVEVSVFGPGVGECIVCHLGQSRWLIVDSFLNFESKKPIAIEYLEGLNVDISKDVALVVASHWHDDHIRGLAQVVEASEQAKFACSAALRSSDFLAMLETGTNIKLVKATSGTDELKTIFDVLQRTKSCRKMTGPDVWAQDYMMLFENDNVQVRSLAPSAHTVTSSIASFAKMIPETGESHKRFQLVKPNHTSVVLQLRIGGISVLLGGDLEVGSNDNCGWRGVLASDHHQNKKSSILKAAHHGSSNGDFPEIWSDLLCANPIVAITPYGKGIKPLPSADDISRIRQQTENAYLTCYPPAKRPEKRRHKMERTINDVLSNRSVSRKTAGMIRIRFDTSEDNYSPEVRLFNGAVDLATV